MGHNPTEHIQEHVTHEAAHGDHGHGAGGHGGGHASKWITAAALTAAFLAAFAAVSSALATRHLTESTLKRIEANDNWNFYQSKSVKSSIMDSRNMAYNTAYAADPTKAPDSVAKQHRDDLAKKIEYNKPAAEDDLETPVGMPGIQEKAKHLEAESKLHLTTHETYEMSATMFHIAIAIVAISVVAKRKEFWYMSIVGGVVGLYFFGSALAHAPSEPAEKHEAATTHESTPHTSGTPAEHATPAAEHKEPPTSAPADHH